MTEGARPINTKKMQILYRLFFANFGLFYGFLLFGIYRFRRIEFQKILGIENRTTFKYTVFSILGIAVLSFLAGVFFRLRYDFFRPLAMTGENGKSAGHYFLRAVAVVIFSLTLFFSFSAEAVGDAIGFKKRATSDEFGYFMLFLCFGVAVLYTLLAGIRLVQAVKKRQIEA